MEIRSVVLGGTAMFQTKWTCLFVALGLMLVGTGCAHHCNKACCDPCCEDDCLLGRLLHPDKYCGCACGEAYYGDWKSHPPECDPCDCHGNYTGCADCCRDCTYLNEGKWCRKHHCARTSCGCGDSCGCGSSGGCGCGGGGTVSSGPVNSMHVVPSTGCNCGH